MWKIKSKMTSLPLVMRCQVQDFPGRMTLAAINDSHHGILNSLLIAKRMECDYI